MEITLPDTVTFYTEAAVNPPAYRWRHLCFTHAVVRAQRGEQIQTKLVERFDYQCDDCAGEKT